MEPVSHSIIRLPTDVSCREKSTAKKGIEQVLKFDLDQLGLPMGRTVLEQILTFIKNNKDQILTLGKEANSRNHARLIKKGSSGLYYDLIVCTEKGEVAVQLNWQQSGCFKIVRKEFVLNDLELRVIAKQRIEGNLTVVKAQREVEILKLLKNNPYVTKMLDTKMYKGKIHKSTDKPIKIIDNAQMISMAYYENGELTHYLGSFSKIQSLEIIREIYLGVQSIHKEGILHRDLKPGNILLDKDYHIKIADFGLASLKKGDPSICKFGGTPIYTAPQFQDTKYHKINPEYTEKGDSWSLGVLTQQICYNNWPFENGKEPKNLNQLRQEFSLLQNKKWPKGQNTISIDYVIYKLLRPCEHERFLPREALGFIDALQAGAKEA